jgi:hypothetical protein
MFYVVLLQCLPFCISTAFKLNNSITKLASHILLAVKSQTFFMVYTLSIQVGACTNHGHLLLLMVVDHSIEPFTYFIFFLIYFVVHVVVIFLSVLGNAITIVAFIQAIRSLSCSACR